MKTNMSVSLLLVIQLLICMSCDFEKSDWEEAKSENTIPAFKNFIKEYTQSAMIDSAYFFIQKISLDSIIAVNTIAAYEEFRVQHPLGHFDSVALDLINDLIPEEPQILNVNIHSTKESSCKVPFDMDVLHKIGSISMDKIPFIEVYLQCGKDAGLFMTHGDSMIQVQPYRCNLFVDYSYTTFARCQGTCVFKVSLKDKGGYKSNEYVTAVEFKD